MSIRSGRAFGAPAAIDLAAVRKKRNIGASAMNSNHRLKIRPSRATVIVCYTINPTKDEACVKPELEFTGSPALPGVPSAADDGNNEKCTYSTLGAMNKKAPEKL